MTATLIAKKINVRVIRYNCSTTASVIAVEKYYGKSNGPRLLKYNGA